MIHVVGWEGPPGAAAFRAVLAAQTGLELADGVPRDAATAVVVVGPTPDIPLLEHVAVEHPGRVIVLTPADGSPVDPWALFAAGAADVIEASEAAVPEVAARIARWHLVDDLVGRVRTGIIGSSPALEQTLRTVVEAARFTEHAILLAGASGTGKELLARLVHTVRRTQREVGGELVLLDCSTVVPDLAGSEFFGHERGAYTGAVGPREGAFARADGGTLFLDEIGELPLHLQPELLRVVQEGMYKRVGGNTWRRTSFGLVCATHRELPKEVADGRFREDLYFRISAWTCRVPDLDERRADILPLARHFLREAGVRVPLSDGVCRYLNERSYPGNIRELRQLMGRIAGRHAGDGPVTLGDLPLEDRPPPPRSTSWPDDGLRRSVHEALRAAVPLEAIKRAAAETAVELALERCGGRTADAAALLGVSPRALQQRRAKRPTS